MIVGNDISGHQKDVDYSVYAHNTHFVIIKASEGVGYTDTKFARNQSESRRVGILLGYYHFARPDLGNQPENEADYFLKVVGELREGEVLCLDYEPASNPFPVIDWCKRFLDRIQAKTRCKALIYLNQSQVRKFDWKPIVDAGYQLWLAAYIPTEQAFTGQWGKMAIQQWTSSQTVPGIPTRVDGDWFFGTFEDFRQLGYKKPDAPSDSPSVSPSQSPSQSPSPSSSPSPSISPSPSPSVSPSPSASSEIPGGSCERKLDKLAKVINGPWWWFGSNAWYIKRAELKKILYANDV